MEKFDKFNPEEESIRAWLGRFKEMLFLKEIEEDKKVLWLKHALGKEHRDALSGLGDEATLSEAEQAVTSAYGAVDEAKEAQEKLRTLTQGTLNLQSLALRAKHLANIAFQGSPDSTRDQQAITAFLKAIPRKLAREVERTPPTNLEAVRREAERQEKLIREDEQSTKPQVSAVQPSAPPPRGACYQCGERGHFKRDCPRRPKPPPGRPSGRTPRHNPPMAPGMTPPAYAMPPQAWMNMWGYSPMPAQWGPAIPWQWKQPWSPAQHTSRPTETTDCKGLRAIMPPPGQKETSEENSRKNGPVTEPLRIEEAVETLNY